MMINPNVGPISARRPPIDPRMILLHHLLGSGPATVSPPPQQMGQGVPAPGFGNPMAEQNPAHVGITPPSQQPYSPGPGSPHGFGPGGSVIGPPTPGPGPGGSLDPQTAIQHLALMLSGNGGSVGVGAGVNPFSGPVDSGYNPAQYQRSIGNDQQAANDWYAHHPGAVREGHIPNWVSQQMTNRLGQAHQDHVGGAHQRAHELAKRIARMRGKRGNRRSLRNFTPPMQAPGGNYS